MKEVNEPSGNDRDRPDDQGHSEQSPVEQEGMTDGGTEQPVEKSKGKSSSDGDFNQIPNKTLAEVLNSIFSLGDHLELLYEDDQIDDNGTFVAAFNKTLLWADHDGNFNVTDLNGPLSVKKVPSKRRRKKKQKENKRGHREEETKDPKSIMEDVMNKMGNEDSENETEENVILRVMHEDSENEETSEVTFEIIDDSPEYSMDQEEENLDEAGSDVEEIIIVMDTEEDHTETDDNLEVSVDDTDAEDEDSEEETTLELTIEEDFYEETEEETDETGDEAYEEIEEAEAKDGAEDEAAEETDDEADEETEETEEAGEETKESMSIEIAEVHDEEEVEEEQAISLVEYEPEKDQAVSLVDESLETSDTEEEEMDEASEEGSEPTLIAIPEGPSHEEKRD